MKRFCFLFAMLICLLFCWKAAALDIRDERPRGKNWKQITDSHYMNIKTVKRVKAKIYQIEFANSVRGASWWNYFTDRIDCDSSMTWTLNTRTNEWVGPLTPSDYHQAATNVVCKKKK